MHADYTTGDEDAVHPPDATMVSELATYMAQNRLRSLEVRFEEPHAAFAWEGRIAVAERASLTDDSVPSDLGLEGVFFVVGN